MSARRFGTLSRSLFAIAFHLNGQQSDVTRKELAGSIADGTATMRQVKESLEYLDGQRMTRIIQGDSALQGTTSRPSRTSRLH